MNPGGCPTGHLRLQVEVVSHPGSPGVPRWSTLTMQARAEVINLDGRAAIRVRNKPRGALLGSGTSAPLSSRPARSISPSSRSLSSTAGPLTVVQHQRGVDTSP